MGLFDCIISALSLQALHSFHYSARARRSIGAMSQTPAALLMGIKFSHHLGQSADARPFIPAVDRRPLQRRNDGAHQHKAAPRLETGRGETRSFS